MRRFAATSILSTAAAAVLVLVRPHPIALAHQFVTPDAVGHADPDVLLADVAASLLWLVAAWLATGIAATLLAAMPGTAGRLMGAASHRLLPGALCRVVAGSAGLGVLLAPIPAMAAPGSADAAAVQHVATALPAPVWPGAQPSVSRPDPPPPSPTKTSDRAVRVRPGDSLWLITAHRLGPNVAPAEVAAAWPRWYAANRDVIGADPDLILPGQLLSPPDGPRPNGTRR
jgi:hypothetical protein